MYCFNISYNIIRIIHNTEAPRIVLLQPYEGGYNHLPMDGFTPPAICIITTGRESTSENILYLKVLSFRRIMSIVNTPVQPLHCAVNRERLPGYGAPARSRACSASHRAMFTPIASISTKNAGGVPLCCRLHALEHQRARGTVRQMRILHS